jgi:hypothetical protein
MSSRAATYQTIRDTLKLLDDPFTRFLDPEQYASLSNGAKGSVTGRAAPPLLRCGTRTVLLPRPLALFHCREALKLTGVAPLYVGVGLEVGFDANLGAESSLVVVAPSSGGPAEE